MRTASALSAEALNREAEVLACLVLCRSLRLGSLALQETAVSRFGDAAKHPALPMKNTPTLQAASLTISIMLIAPGLTLAEPMTYAAHAPQKGIAASAPQRKAQSALANVTTMPTAAGMGTLAEVRASLPPGRNRAGRSTSPGSPRLSFDGLPQLVHALPVQVVQALPDQLVPALSGQLSAPLPGQLTRALPGQLVQPLPGQITPPLPGQILR